MPSHISLEERAAELERNERDVRRKIRLALLRTSGLVLVSLAVALVLMGVGIHSSEGGGQIPFLGGLILGYSGVVFSFARLYLRGIDRGWWL
jgi:hypothetical protein